MRNLLKLTIYETYEYDEQKILEKYKEEWEEFKRKYSRYPNYITVDNFIIETFEIQNGSILGDENFGQINCDSGIELEKVEDDY